MGKVSVLNGPGPISADYVERAGLFNALNHEGSVHGCNFSFVVEQRD